MKSFDLDCAFTGKTQSKSSSIHGSGLPTLSLVAVDPANTLAIPCLPFPVLAHSECKHSANLHTNLSTNCF